VDKVQLETVVNLNFEAVRRRVPSEFGIDSVSPGELELMLTSFWRLREVHAVGVKISRMFGRGQNPLAFLLGFYMNY
jgi:hypothetical protein